ncbi:MAG: N-acetyltransferase [Pseudomonadota bacterium]
MTDAGYEIRLATADDKAAILELLPRLGSFTLPPGRDSRDLWRHDAALLERWARGEADQCIVHVAVDDAGAVIGLVMTSLRPEMLSEAPSAHLEAIAVAPGTEGKGLGQSLIDTTEAAAKAAGAESITLHVFGTNSRARRLYERVGYREEIIRCWKAL